MTLHDHLAEARHILDTYQSKEMIVTRELLEALVEAGGVAVQHVEERPQTIISIHNHSSSGRAADYWRRRGSVESRRQLAQALHISWQPEEEIQ